MSIKYQPTNQPTQYTHDTNRDENGGGNGNGEEEEDEARVGERDEESELTMEACLGEFVSYQTVSASEEAFHKEGTCVRYCVDGWRDGRGVTPSFGGIYRWTSIAYHTNTHTYTHKPKTKKKQKSQSAGAAPSS